MPAPITKAPSLRNAKKLEPPADRAAPGIAQEREAERAAEPGPVPAPRVAREEVPPERVWPAPRRRAHLAGVVARVRLERRAVGLVEAVRRVAELEGRVVRRHGGARAAQLAVADAGHLVLRRDRAGPAKRVADGDTLGRRVRLRVRHRLAAY